MYKTYYYYDIVSHLDKCFLQLRYIKTIIEHASQRTTVKCSSLKTT